MRRCFRISFSTVVLMMAAGQSSASIISNFNTNNGGWDSAGYPSAGSGYPNFSGAAIAGAVAYNASGGNPGGYISKADPDGNWQYFRAPALFLGDESSALGGSLTFDLIRLDTFPTAVLNPQGPIVAVTNGSTTLVYAGTEAVPTGSWGSYAIPLTADGKWKVTDPAGAAATLAQLTTVFSGLTGLYVQADFLNGSGANGEIIGLDNVVLGGPTATPEPASAAICFAGLGMILFARRFLRRILVA